MRRKSILLLFISALLLSGLLGCNNRKDETQLTIKLIDRAGPFEAVNIQILELEALINEKWSSLNLSNATYEVTKFVNGKDTILVDQFVQKGQLSGIRITLGAANNVVVGGNQVPVFLINQDVTAPEITLNIEQELIGDGSLTIILDFDAARSIVDLGNDRYGLAPTFRAFTENEEAAISGSASPLEANPTILALIGQDTLASTFTDNDGNYRLRGLQEGNYTIVITPVIGFDEVILNDITLSAAESRQLDPVELPPDN